MESKPDKFVPVLTVRLTEITGPQFERYNWRRTGAIAFAVFVAVLLALFVVMAAEGAFS